MTNSRQWHCGNPVCYCTGDCMGKTHASPSVFTQEVVKHEINPNRGGPIHSAPDTLTPRFNVRGRSDTDGMGTFEDRLRDQVENGKAWEMAHVPEIELGRAWLKGLEFGGEE